jgi:3-deoxy-D-manno-octulosonate 8-phosphate phosphatase (KDO 8-P phosphatase)
MQVIIVIPARLASTRLPEKPLQVLEGKPLVQHTYEAAQRVPGVARVLVAADDPRIVEAVQRFGGDALVTSRDHATGTDRLAEVAERVEADLYVNLQCDEPLVRPEALAALVEGMRDAPEIDCGTLFHRVSPAEAARPSVVKVVTGHGGDALYFSRAPIPYPRDGSAVEYKKHVGIYAYRRELLRRYASLPQPMEEKAESLEQLRLLHAGVRIRCFEVEPSGPGVDTPEDLEAVGRILRGETQGEGGSGLAGVALVMTDVDGVLTDGGLYYDAAGEALKRFDVRDGLGVKLLRAAGVRVAAVSGRSSAATQRRLEELGFDAIVLGVDDKARAVDDLLARFAIAPAQAAFLGDDLQDLPAFERCGHAFAPADAAAPVRARATAAVLEARGGRGALRELADRLLSARAPGAKLTLP